jgi:PAS domain S-box-containing protein
MTPYNEHDEYFRLLTESVDIVAIIAGDGTLKYVSLAVERCLGFKPEELIGRNFQNIVHLEDREHVLARLESFSNSFDNSFSKGPVIPHTFRLQHKDGSWRFVESVARDLRHRPLIQGIVVTMCDVTERIRLEREVAQLSRLTGLGRLATQVAHEFNNVLMGIQSFISVIRRRTSDDPQILRMTDLMTASVERGRRITHDILRFSRPAEPSFTIVDVSDLLSAAAEEIRPRLTGITLEVVLPPEPLSILADRGQIMQVLINLATNSSDAMREQGGTLTIAAVARDTSAPFRTLLDAQPFVHFTVTDTGEGIAPEALDHVFEPMFTTKRTGTGLGLSVVHQVVTLHNGHVFVESTRGWGTSMHVFLPRGATEAGGERMAALEYVAPPLRVLIVEDDPMVAEGITAALAGEGLVARAVHSGREALVLVERFEPDLLLLDIRLPDADGRDIYDQLAKLRPDLPVIFSTGHVLETEFENYLRRPNVGFLLKPYRIDELLKTIIKVVS